MSFLTIQVQGTLLHWGKFYNRLISNLAYRKHLSISINMLQAVQFNFVLTEGINFYHLKFLTLNRVD